MILLVVFGLAETISAGEKQKTILQVSGGAEVLLQVPSWSEVLVGGRVVVLEPDFLHLSAYDAKTGKRSWRKKYQDKANGGQSLHLIDGKLFAWTGNKIRVVNPKNGRIRKTFNAAWNRNSDRCSLGQEGDTCYFDCQCRFWLFDCRNGKELGPKLQKNYVEFHDLDGGSSGGCYGPGHKIIGRAGDLLVMSKQGKRAEDDKRYGRPIEIVGLDTKTGEESWRCAECSPDEYFFFSGVSEDEAICWLGNYTGALRVFSCQTGKLHFSGDLTPKSKPHTWRRTAITWLEKPRGLFRYFDGQAEMLDGRPGSRSGPRSLTLISPFCPWAPRSAIS